MDNQTAACQLTITPNTFLQNLLQTVTEILGFFFGTPMSITVSPTN